MLLEDFLASCNFMASVQYEGQEELDGETVVVLHKVFNALEIKDGGKALAGALNDFRVLQILRNKLSYPRHLSLLHHCVKKGLHEKMESLLRAGASVDAIEVETNATALHLASAFRSEKSIRILLNHGASTEILASHVTIPVNVRGGEAIGKVASGTALDIAIQTNHSGIVELLSNTKEALFANRLHGKMRFRIANQLTAFRREKRVAEEIWRDIEAIEAHEISLSDAERSDRLRTLYSKSGFRTKKRIQLLVEELRALEELLNTNDSSNAVKDVLMNETLKCPVCMDIPNGSVYCCLQCNNLLCGPCLTNLYRFGNPGRCPSCREDLSKNPMIRNRLIERIVEVVKK